MKSNKSKFAIVGLLSRGPASGYDLRKLIEERISHFWSESFGQIYPILKQLTVERLARRKVERQIGKPDRQVYSLTDRGEAALDEWLRKPAEFQVARNETMLKLFLGSQVEVDVSIEHVNRYRDHQLQLLDEYTEIERILSEEEGGTGDLPFQLMTVSHAKQQCRAAIRWADEALRQLSELQASRASRRRRRR